MARRYDDGAKLNMKKVFAVIIAFLLFIACIFGIIKLLDNDGKNENRKIENVCYYTIYKDEKWGVIDSYGKVIIKAEYDDMIVIPDETKDVFVCTYDANYESGEYKTKVINSKGKEIIKDYDKVEAIANYDKENKIWYEENVFRTQKNGKYGLINYSGNVLLNCEYDNIEPVYGIENSLVVERQRKIWTL